MTSTDLRMEKLSNFGATLAFISTIIGGGIVSIPYAFICSGFSVGIIVNLVGVGAMMSGLYFYLKTKDILKLE